MIETKQAVANLDAILSTPGLDGIYVGPADLAISMGFSPQGDPTEPAVVKAIETIVAGAKRHKVYPGIHCGSTDGAKTMIRRGFQFTTILSDNAPEDQRTRCETKPFSGPMVAGRTFELAPSAELKAELEANAAGDLWDACGPNGVTMNAVQFWEARNGYALFHMLGQDDAPWDPASFTFYRKGAGGKWAKAG